MSVRLATHLLQERMIPPSRVDDLLQLQVVAGGALDTLLLEANLVDEMHLLAAMGEAFKLPIAGRDEIDDIPPRLTEIFPRAFAETYRLIPYRMVDRNLGVLVAEPPNPNIIARIEQRLRIYIHPAITTEARLLYALNKLYDVPLGERYAELLRRLDQAAEPIAAPAPPPPPPEPEAAPVPSPAPAVMQIDLDTALRRLTLGQTRDQLIDVLLGFANQTFQFAGLFIAVDGRLLGFRGRGDANGEYRISHVRVPLNVASMFRTVHDTHAPYLGQVPTGGINLEIINELGRGQPKTTLLVPFLIANKVAGILYADNGRRGVPSKRVADILVCTTQLGRHFERLIKRKKSEVRVAMAEANEPFEPAATMSEPEAEAPLVAPPPTISTESLTFSALSAEASRQDAGVEPLAPILPAPQPALVFESEAGEDDEAAPNETPVSFEEPTIPAAMPSSVAEPTSQATANPARDNWAVVPADSVATAPEVPVAAPKALASDSPEVLAERLRNILKAAEEDDADGDDGDPENEMSISLDDVSADAVLATAPHSPMPAAASAKPAPAFKDIDEHDAEENLAGWESVLVDTISAGKQGGSSEAPDSTTPAQPPEEMAWGDVIVEAQEALLAEDNKAQLVIDESQVLLDALDGPDPDAAARAAESLWNQYRAGLVDTLGPRFPGRLTIDPFATGIVLPSIGEVSLVLRLLAALGQDAVPAVLPHIDSPYPVHRLLATLFFGQIVSGKAFSKLLRRLFDEEPRVRDVAAEVLRKYKSVQGFDEGVQRIRDRLSLPVIEAQVRATEILGRLRDSKSIPLLVPLTASRRPELANATLGALMRLTAQDFGHNPKKWTEWWVKNSDRAREQWLIDGMKRKEPILKVIADEELRRATGLTFNFRIDGDKRAQELAIRGWESWWDSEQKAREKLAASRS